MVLLSARKDRVPSCEGVKYWRSVRAAYQPIRAVSKQLKSVPAVCNRRVPAVLAVQALSAVVSSLAVVWTSPDSILFYSYSSGPFHKQVLKNRKIVLVSSFHSLFIAQSFIAVIFTTNKTFDVFSTVYHSTELFHLSTLMHNSLFINNMYVTLLSSTYFEH